MIVDQDARDVTARDLARNVVVEAGAGSGKTTAIIDRIVALVGSGVPLASVVAVTFTEAAAGDLRTRLRAAFEAVAAGGAERAERARDALDHLDDAAIGTVHSWARRLIAEFPIELGIPPRFDVLDEVQASMDRARAWRSLLTSLLSEPELERSIAALDAAGYRLWQLRDAYDALNDELDRLESGAQERTTILPVDVAIDPVLAAIDAATAHAAECRDRDDKLLAILDDLAGVGSALRTAEDDLDVLELLCGHWPSPGNAGRARNWPDKGLVIEAVQEVGATVGRVRSDAIGAAVANVVARLVAHVRTEAANRRRVGELQFPDLLVLARDLLRGSPVARRRIHDRIAVVIIDEFQDTDPIQIELATLVATDVDDVGGAPWWDLPIPDGRLVVVGDPKQSIYRFRRADLRVFRRVLEVHAPSRVVFTTNFRSRPGILRWVDECIGTQLSERAAADSARQAEHVPLDPHREAGLDRPSVLLVGDAHDGTLAEARDRESEDLASLLGEIQRGCFLVEDPGRTFRPARLGDVAILLPTRITLPYLEHALARHGIPMRIESESLVLATETVRELLVLLEAVVDPNDAIAVVAALRTPALACRDDDLARHALAEGEWSYLTSVPDASPASVRRGLATLRELHHEVVLSTVDRSIEHIIRVCRLLELGVAHPRPRDHWRRLLYVADLSRAFAEAGGTNLREFTAWLRERAEAELRTLEVPVPEPDDDAVRVLTVHGAKGLEFPITIVAGLNVVDQTATSPVLWRDGTKPVLTGVGVRPDDYHELFALERSATSAEAVRLLYVAATRARDHLIVSLHRTTERCAAGRLAERSGRVPELWSRWTPAEGRAASPARSDAAPADLFDLEAWQVEHDEILARGSGRAATSATALAGVDKPEPDAEDPPHRRGRAGTAIGRAVHATLQSVDLDSAARLDAVVRAQAFAEGIPELEGEVRALASSALTAPIVRAAVEGGRYWREVPVGAKVDGAVIEGFVDLLVETSDGLVVVDYKTDRIAGLSEIATCMGRYRVQGAAYALALETTLGRPVVRCVFVFTTTTGAVEREIEDLPGALREARHRLVAV